MFKPAILLIPLVLCSCAPRQDNVVARSDDGKPPEALFPVKTEGGQYGYIDRSGKLVLKGPYAGASRFAEGLAAVQMKKAGKVGYIDTTGKLVIPLQFDLGDWFSEGVAAVMVNHKWGYVDKTGKLVIPFSFGIAQPFESGRAAVGTGPTGEFGFINTKGEFPLANRYEMAMPYREGLAAVRSFTERVKFIDWTVNPQFHRNSWRPGNSWMGWLQSKPKPPRACGGGLSTSKGKWPSRRNTPTHCRLRKVWPPFRR